MKPENLKGTKDFSGEEKVVRDSIMNTLQQVFELYGFNPLETPIMEKWDILSGKYAGGSEIMKEAYKLTDQGKRELGLRYDLTVPLARFIGMNPTVKLPFKRYQIAPVFRDGPIKKGRLRQFYQADADILGTKSMLADAECIRLALDAFDRLGIKVEIKLNNRKLLNALVKKAGIKKSEEAIISLDKLEKIGEKEVLKEMKQKGIENASDLMDLIGSDVRKTFKNDEGMKEIEEVLELVNDKRVVFTPSLARGLAYYTGTIFEATAKEIDVSIGGGGRYDDMIGKMVGRNEYPAVGFSFGIEPICELLKEKVDPGSIAKVLVVGIGVTKEVDEVAAVLREANIRTDRSLSEKGVTKALDFANSYKIPFVVIIGKKEVEAKKVTLKDMKSGKEELLSLQEAVKKLS